MQVVCTGKEDRLLDCRFPEDFGGNDGSYDNSKGSAPADTGMAEGRDATVPPHSRGLDDAGCTLNPRGDNRQLAVICWRFEIKGVPHTLWQGEHI